VSGLGVGGTFLLVFALIAGGNQQPFLNVGS